MITPRTLGFIAVVSLVSAAVLGRQVLRRDPSFRKVIASLLFCSVGGIASSYIRAPLVVWPLALAMLCALIFMVWSLQIECRCKERRALEGPPSAANGTS